MTSPALPRRPLGAAEVLDGAVRIVRRNPRAAFGFALPVAFVQALLGALVVLGTYSSSDLGTVSQLLRLLVSASAGAVLSGLIAPVVVADSLGSPISAGEAWRRARTSKGLLLLVVLGLGVGLVESLGLVLALVGGAWLWGVWAVAGPAMTVERLGVFAAVKRSYRLASRCFWRAWGVRALGWVVAEVLALLIDLPFASFAAYLGRVGFGASTGDITHPAVYVTVVALGQLLSVALVAPITAAVDAIIYVDLRMRVEGLDIVLAAPPAPSAPRVPVAGPAW